jgi:hypothetical protein
MMTKHMVQRSLTFLALTSILGCAADPTGDLHGGPDHLVATPSTLYVGNGTTATVIVSSVDEQGNQVEDDFRLAPADVGANISVSLDTTYSRVRNEAGVLVPDPHATRVRYNITTNAYVESEFTVRAGGRSITIPVRTRPVTLVSPVSNLTPALGDTVTITAPAGLSFHPDSSVVTFGGGAQATHLVSRSADAISFVPPPAAGGAPSVSVVSLDYEPGPRFTVPTAEPMTVPPIPALIVAPTGSQAIGATLTATLPAPFRWSPVTAAATRTAILIGTAQTSTPVLAVDSVNFQFQVGPGAAGDSIAITNVRLIGAPTIGPFTIKSAETITTPTIDAPGSFAQTTGETGDTITLTLTDSRVKFRRPGGGISFLVSQVATPGIVVSISADSNTIKVLPPPFTAGPATLTGLYNPSIPSVALNLTATNEILYGATPAQSRYNPARLDPGTALSLPPLPAVGDSIEIYDSWDPDGAVDQFYAFTAPDTTQNYTFTTDWEGDADIDVLRCPSTSLTCASVGSLGASSNQPESATINLGNSAANQGPQRVYVNLYAGTAPRWIRIKIKRNS